MFGQVTPLEERYMRVRRRRSDYRDDPPPRRMAPKRQAPARRQASRKRGAVTSVAMGFYKALVVISALIVAVYIGVSLMMKTPEQKTLPPPVQNGTGISLGPGSVTNSGSNTADSSGTAAPALSRREGVYTIFLAATDAEGTRTDTMMVLCYDTVEQTVGVVSIPRDTLVARTEGNPHLVYGKGGVERRVEDVSNMLGIPIDYYVKVNIKGFITLVDYLGGVDFYVPCNMDYDDPYQNLYIHYKKGQQKLSGQQAMEVARFRKNNDGTGYTDTGRTETQQKLLIALAKKVLSWNNITKLNGFVEIFNNNVSTDLSMDHMLYFANKAMGLDPSAAVETATLEGNGFGKYRGYTYCYELDPETTLETVNRLINPYDRDLTLEDMNIAKADSYYS